MTLTQKLLAIAAIDHVPQTAEKSDISTKTASISPDDVISD